ncbi:MAG: CDP-diacylglycerol--glycerol-3-phosphate 3-phosphatidyltransferase [Acidobacteriota bacterium]
MSASAGRADVARIGPFQRQLPNLLSAFRILLVPPLILALVGPFVDREWYALGIFIVAALTDWIDGALARRWDIESRLGKLLDPAADKILTMAAFVSLVAIGYVAAWLVIVILAREFAVSTLRSVAASEGIVIAAGIWGKIKTVLQMIAIPLLIIIDHLGSWDWLATTTFHAAVWASVLSGVWYFYEYGRRVSGRVESG